MEKLFLIDNLLFQCYLFILIVNSLSKLYVQLSTVLNFCQDFS